MRIGIAEEQEGEEKENLPMNGGTMAGTAMASDCDRVVSALSQTKKGQLKYDTKWKEEGRTEEIVNTVEEDLFSINSRPLNGINGVRNVNGLNGNGVGQQSVSFGYQNNNSNNNHHNEHQQLNSTVKPEIQNDTGDHVSGEAASRSRFRTQPQHQQHQPPSSSLVKDENEELIKQYELERSEKVQERVEETAALLRANYDALLEKMDSEMRLITNNFILMKLQTQRAYEEEYANLLQSMMAQEQNLLAGQKTGTTTSSSEGPHPATSSKLKELQERQKLLERQKELRLQQQTEYRERVTRAKEAISRTLADCEAARLQAEQQQQQPQPLQLDASVAEQLQHCRTLLLAAISELEVMLLTTTASSSSSSQPSELTAEHLKVAAEKQQQATAVGQRYLALLTRQQQQQQQPQSSTVIQNASESAAAARKAQPPTSSTSAQAAQLAAAPRSAASTGPSSSTQPKQQPPSASSSTANSNVPEFSHPAELIYERSQLELLRFEQVVDRFIGAEENKKRRTSLQISIRTRINTMCNEAVSKLADKTRKLLDLLSGQRVESKGEMLQCTPADGSLHFAINTAVMAFLNVAIKQKNMALRLAPVVSVLWSRLDPLFGRVFLAQLYRVCPYAVPYYPVQEEEEGGLSAEEFMVRCGYQLNAQSGAISETDEAFQERIYSLVQLYAAVLQCNVTEANGGGNKGASSSNPIVHPRDLQFAWHWLARVLNGRPQAVMTALMLDAFLAVSAHKLLAAYGRQFEKVLRLIRRTTVPAMEAVTPKGEQQTLMKFKSLLEGFERKVARLAGQQQQRGGGGGGSRLQQQVARSLLPEDMELVPDAFFRI